MKLLTLGALPLSSCATQNDSLLTEIPEAAPPSAEFAWLQQLVGEWTIDVEASMGPEGEMTQMLGSESVRTIGSQWVFCEGRGEQNQHSAMTLGYDPAKEKFVGTWVDSTGPMLWVYSGQLDETRKILALDAEGPSFDDPTKTAWYRDSIEIKSADHRVLTSAFKNPDGTFTTMLRAEYRRKR